MFCIMTIYHNLYLSWGFQFFLSFSFPFWSLCTVWGRVCIEHYSALPDFLEVLSVQPCCPTLCQHLSTHHLHCTQCGFFTAVNGFCTHSHFLIWFATQRLGSCSWRLRDGSPCVWTPSAPSLSSSLPLGPWFWQRVSADASNYLWYDYNL